MNQETEKLYIRSARESRTVTQFTVHGRQLHRVRCTVHGSQFTVASRRWHRLACLKRRGNRELSEISSLGNAAMDLVRPFIVSRSDARRGTVRSHCTDEACRCFSARQYRGGAGTQNLRRIPESSIRGARLHPGVGDPRRDSGEIEVSRTGAAVQTSRVLPKSGGWYQTLDSIRSARLDRWALDNLCRLSPSRRQLSCRL